MFKNESDFEKIVSRLNIDNKPNPAHRENLRRQMLSVFNKARTKTLHAGHWQTIGRTIMKRPITKLAAAAVIIIALLIGLNVLTDTKATAAQILTEAAEAVANLKSIYIKVQMRTIAHDNFELIRLDCDFVPIKMWKEFDGTFHGKWRVEKPRRVVVMDGQSSLLLIKSTYAAKGDAGTGFVGWIKSLLDVDKIIKQESSLAVKYNSDMELTHEKVEDGSEKLVVTIEAKAQGDFTNDWLKNKSISASDNLRIYTFDAETKLLESLEVYVHTEEEDVLVLEITNIKYNLEIEPELFTLELPENVIWFEEPKELVDNEKYQQMTPKEVARAFFQACTDEDWDEYLKLAPASGVGQEIKNYLGGLEIIEIGEPFKSGRYPGWFVPYEIKFRNGYIKKKNLAVRNDNPANRYVVDGGF